MVTGACVCNIGSTVQSLLLLRHHVARSLITEDVHRFATACVTVTELQRLGAPTAMLAAAGHLCIGGAAGGIACVPVPSLRRGSAEGAFELRDAGGMGRLLTSLFARWGHRWPLTGPLCSLQALRMLQGFSIGPAKGMWYSSSTYCVCSGGFDRQEKLGLGPAAEPACDDICLWEIPSERTLHACTRRPSTPAVRSLVAVPAGDGRQLLGAAYSDASLRLWNVARQACALHEPLKPDSTTAEALSPTRAAYAAAPAGEPGRPGKLVLQFDAPAGAGGGAAADRRPPVHRRQLRTSGMRITSTGSVMSWSTRQPFCDAACLAYSSLVPAVNCFVRTCTIYVGQGWSMPCLMGHCGAGRPQYKTMGL